MHFFGQAKWESGGHSQIGLPGSLQEARAHRATIQIGSWVSLSHLVEVYPLTYKGYFVLSPVDTQSCTIFMRPIYLNQNISFCLSCFIS